MAKERYIENVGRRKTASARTRITPAKKTKIEVLVDVDGKQVTKKFEEYFPTKALQETILDVFKVEGDASLTFEVTAVINGGGIAAQAEAVRHGIARGLIEHNPELRAHLKAQGFLKRDPRVKERKKPGLRKARRAPQWSKR
jgi:small subunit ribosomal protein S9